MIYGVFSLGRSGIDPEYCCAICLVSGGLLLHSFVKLLQVERGFHVDKLVTVDLTFSGNRYSTDEKRAVALKILMDRVLALPDIKDAAVANRVPLTGEGDNEMWYPRQVRTYPSHNGRLRTSAPSVRIISGHSGFHCKRDDSSLTAIAHEQWDWYRP